jgi:hypothetical protein
VASSPYSDVNARLERIRKLCDELEQAQHDNRKYRQLIDRIRDEAESFRETLGTHDAKP